MRDILRYAGVTKGWCRDGRTVFHWEGLPARSDYRRYHPLGFATCVMRRWHMGRHGLDCTCDPTWNRLLEVRTRKCPRLDGPAKDVRPSTGALVIGAHSSGVYDADSGHRLKVLGGLMILIRALQHFDVIESRMAPDPRLPPAPQASSRGSTRAPRGLPAQGALSHELIRT